MTVHTTRIKDVVTEAGLRVRRCLDWETIESGAYGTLMKLPVPGGWLVRQIIFGGSCSLEFVPRGATDDLEPLHWLIHSDNGEHNATLAGHDRT